MRKIGRLPRAAALLLLLMVALSTAALAVSGELTEKLERAVSAAPTADRASVWRCYNDATAKQSAGDYRGAITDYASAAKHFAENGDPVNEINAYRQIAECYGSAGEYGMASAAWSAAAQRCAAYIAATGEAEKVEEQISYERNAAALETVTELYQKSDEPVQNGGTYFGAPGEPVNGLVVGAYAENNKAVHEHSGSKRYWNDFPTVTGVDAGVYLLYFTYGKPLSDYEKHINAAREKGFAIELALQPLDGLAAVREDDERLIHLARDVARSGVQFYIRFAGEMNDSSGGNNWYTEDAAEYIRAFRAVADVFHTHAPSAAMVWAPNYYPDHNIDGYYPGDEYVDMVGVSFYMAYQPELNPLGTGAENRRWIDGLDALYARYGSRKPMMIAEGAVGLATADGRDLSAFAAEQLSDLFLYLPIRYPNVKLVVWFDSNDTVGTDVYDCLTSNQVALDAFRQAIVGSDSVLPSVSAPAAPVYYGRLRDGADVPDGKTTLCSYVKGVTPIASVRYAINGAPVGESETAPYELPVDFAAYRGQTVTVTVSSYYENGSPADEQRISLRVAGTVSGGTAYERTLALTLDGAPASLRAYALKDENDYETNYVGLRDLAALMNGTAARFNVGWDGVAINIFSKTAYAANGAATSALTGERSYRVNTAETRIDGVTAKLNSIVLTDDKGGYTYYELRDLAQAIGFTVGWSLEEGIFIRS